jgi:hypothetical protein
MLKIRHAKIDAPFSGVPPTVVCATRPGSVRVFVYCTQRTSQYEVSLPVERSHLLMLER